MEYRTCPYGVPSTPVLLGSGYKSNRILYYVRWIYSFETGPELEVQSNRILTCDALSAYARVFNPCLGYFLDLWSIRLL